MKIKISLVAFLFALIPFLSVSQEVNSYESNLSLAKSKEKNVLLFFTATWCGPCKQMKKEVIPDVDVSKVLNEKFILYYCDVDTKEGQELKVRYDVLNGIPEFIIVNGSEEIVNRRKGGMDKDTFLQFLVEDTSDSELLKPNEKDVRFLSVLYGLKDSTERNNIQSILSSPMVKDKIAERKFDVIDASLLGTKYERWLNQKSAGETPILLVMNKSRHLLARHEGAIDQSELLRLLDLDTAIIDVSKYRDLVTLKEHGCFDRFMGNMLGKEWRPGINVGINTSSINNSGSNYKIGYELGLIVDYTPKRLKDKFVFQTGFILNSIGWQDKATSDNVRVNYLEMPLRFNYEIFRHGLTGCTQPVRLSLSPYAAYRIGDKNLDSNWKPARWDYGLKAGLNIRTGVLETFIGYQQGIANIASSGDKDYRNHGFFFTTTLVFGK